MEGFQHSSEACWKMTMVLSTLVEVVVFCNRNSRTDVLLEAAQIFAKGMSLSKTLSMSPVTKQVFIQIHSDMFKKSHVVAEVINDVREILQSPEIEIRAFCIPEIPGCDIRELPFHPQVVDAVQTLLQQFQFRKDTQAAAAKATQLEMLLDAFNKGDFTTCDKLGLRFLKMDSDRIYKQALAEHREKHETLASKLKLTSVDTTFAAFMGQPDWCLDLRFKTSPYYSEKYERNLQEWYLPDQRSVKMLEIYERHYKSKMDSLKAKLETEELERQAKASQEKAEEAKLRAEQDNKKAEEAKRLAEIAMQNEYQAALRRLINAAIEAAKGKLGREIAELEKKYRPIYNDSCFKSWELFIDKQEVQKYAREKDLSTQPDWSPFETYYNNEKVRIKNAWNAQIERAKWKEPVKAMGELKCASGHTVTDDVCCNKDSKCDGRLFWIDGPNRMVLCIKCSSPNTIGDSLICMLCKANASCVPRPTNYMP
ncbi:unnamed protein product [Adineta steineri]|uniref:Uncharacterized protein n=1 Tax=Adineta steineri TaxID=433720 RepID=A0A819IWB1_9BILA|nr:unnamed protein product [Adineta steineri]CAF3919821.1 unnamed protein product [Adineta steineri]